MEAETDGGKIKRKRRVLGKRKETTDMLNRKPIHEHNHAINSDAKCSITPEQG